MKKPEFSCHNNLFNTIQKAQLSLLDGLILDMKVCGEPRN